MPADTLPAAAPAATGGELSAGAALGRYKVVRTLGAGGMGVVYEADDPMLGRRVALKVIRGQANEALSARLLREAQAMAQIAHPNVIPIHDAGIMDGRVFLAMELVEGRTLRRWIEERPRAWREVVDVFLQAGAGLLAAHGAGLVHRDFKPDNVMIDSNDRVRVLDFGLARISAGEPRDGKTSTPPVATLTATGAAAGTPLYMAPEQHAAVAIDNRADQFAFVVALYEALTGQHPFAEDSYDALVSRVAAGDVRSQGRPVRRRLRAVLRRGMSVAPADRYPSMAELLADLRRIRFAVRRRWLVASSAVIAAAAVVIGIGQLRQERRAGAVSTADAGVSESARPGAPPLAARQRQLTTLGDVRRAEISPDGRWLAFARTEPTYYLRDLAGGELRALATGRHRLWSARWAPDSESVALMVDDEVRVVARDGAVRARIEASLAADLAWSHDGRELAMVQYQPHKLLLWEPAGGRAAREIPLQLDNAGLGIAVDWSRANRILIGTARSTQDLELWTLPAAGGPASLVVREAGELLAARWEPDGTAILYVRGRGISTDLVRLPVDSTTGAASGPASIVMSGLAAASHLSLTANGKGAVYSRATPRGSLWLFGLDRDQRKVSERRRLLGGPSWKGSPSVSPDGTRVAFSMGTGEQQEIHVLGLDEGAEPRRLTSLGVTSDTPVWSPDGSRIAFRSTAGGASRIWLMAADGGSPRALEGTRVSDVARYGGLSWSTDGLLYLHADNRDVHRLDPDLESDSSLLGDQGERGFAHAPRLSPDGQTLALFWNLSDGSGLWVRPRVGGESRLLAPRRWPFAWSADGARIWTTNPDDVGRPTVAAIGFPGGREGRRISIDIDPGLGMTFALVPGDRGFVCAVDETEFDAWLAESP